MVVSATGVTYGSCIADIADMHRQVHGKRCQVLDDQVGHFEPLTRITRRAGVRACVSD
jgi:hypothetical protein